MRTVLVRVQPPQPTLPGDNPQCLRGVFAFHRKAPVCGSTRAGISPRGSHRLRDTFAGYMLPHDVPLADVSRLPSRNSQPVGDGLPPDIDLEALTSSDVAKALSSARRPSNVARNRYP